MADVAGGTSVTVDAVVEASDKELGRRSAHFPDPGVPWAVPVDEFDPLWHRLFRRAYAVLERKNDLARARRGRPVSKSVMTFYAKVASEWVYLQTVPRRLRGVEWPSSFREFCGRLGKSEAEVRAILFSAGVQKWQGRYVQDEPREEKVRQLKDVLYNQALKQEDVAPEEFNVALAKAALEAHGGMPKQGHGGTRVQVNVSAASRELSPEEYEVRAERLAAYLEEKRQNALPPQSGEVPSAVE